MGTKLLLCCFLVANCSGCCVWLDCAAFNCFTCVESFWSISFVWETCRRNWLSLMVNTWNGHVVYNTIKDYKQEKYTQGKNVNKHTHTLTKWTQLNTSTWGRSHVQFGYRLIELKYEESLIIKNMISRGLIIFFFTKYHESSGRVNTSLFRNKLLEINLDCHPVEPSRFAQFPPFLENNNVVPMMWKVDTKNTFFLQDTLEIPLKIPIVSQS